MGNLQLVNVDPRARARDPDHVDAPDVGPNTCGVCAVAILRENPER